MNINPSTDSANTAFHQSVAIIKESLLNFLLISLLFAACALTVRFDAQLNLHSSEVSLTEFSEKALLLLNVGYLFYISRTNKSLKQAALIMSAFFLVCFIREMDYLFDKIVHGFWVYPALAVTALGIWFSTKPFNELVNQLAAILGSRSGGLLIIAMAVLLVFSRLWGMGDFWKDVMDAEYMRVVKTTSEEGIELLAYYMITYSVFKLPIRKSKN